MIIAKRLTENVTTRSSFIRRGNASDSLQHHQHKLTSNMTGRHQGLKQKLWSGYRPPSLKWTSYVLTSSVTDVIFFIVECGIARFLCAMRVLKVRASSSPPRLPLCQVLFLSQPPLLS